MKIETKFRHTVIVERFFALIFLENHTILVKTKDNSRYDKTIIQDSIVFLDFQI